MLNIIGARARRMAIVITSAIVGLVLVSASVAAAAGCKQIHGKFTLTPVAGPSCASAIGVCATGSYTGGILASSAFTGSSIVPTADTPATAVVLLTGDNLIHTQTGDLITKDAIVLRTAGAGEFAEIDTVVGGTGEWANATGVINATGTFTGAAGGSGTYDGQICTP